MLNDNVKNRAICFFYGDFNGTGGAERAAISVANGLAKKSYKVYLLSLSGGDRPFFPVAEGVEVLQLFDQKLSFKKNYFKVASRIRAFAKERKIDVWVDVDPVISVFSIPALLGWRGLQVAWEHFNFTNDLGRIERRIGRRLAARFSDVVVLLTQRDREMWLDKLKPKATVAVIPNPCPFEPPKEERFDPDAKIVLSVGRLIDLKGFDLLLQAWATVRRRARDLIDWKLTIVGDGPEAASLRDMARNLGVSDSVVFAGRQSEVRFFYEGAGIYCLSSRAEGLPMVLIEAQAYGLPIVAFDCPTGPSELVENGRNGVLVPPQDVGALANALESVMLDREKRVAFARNARLGADRFDHRVIANRWSELCGGDN